MLEIAQVSKAYRAVRLMELRIDEATASTHFWFLRHFVHVIFQENSLSFNFFWQISFLFCFTIGRVLQYGDGFRYKITATDLVGNI